MRTSTLQLEDVEVRWADDQPPVLSGINLVITPGERLAVVGANGSGKSTFARLLAGLVSASGGRINGELAQEADLRAGLVLQDPTAQAVGATVADDVAFGLECQRMAHSQMHTAVANMLDRFDLSSLALRPTHLLSGGQRQRLAVAAVMVCGLDLLVLDEPTSQLDAENRRLVSAAVDQLRGSDVAVLWVTQIAEEIGAFERVVAFEQGRIIFDGSPRALFADPSLVVRLRIGLPAATRFGIALRDRGISLRELPLTESELVAALVEVC